MFIIIGKNDFLSIVVWKTIVNVTKTDPMSLADNESNDGDSEDDAVL